MQRDFCLVLQMTIGNARYRCSCVRYVTSELNKLWLIVGLAAGLGLLLIVVIVASVAISCRKRGGKAGGGRHDVSDDIELNRNAATDRPAYDNPEYRDNSGVFQDNLQPSTVDPDMRNEPNQNYLTPREDVVNQNYLTPREDNMYSSYLSPTDAITNQNYITPYEASHLPD